MTYSDGMFPDCPIHGTHTGDACPRCDASVQATPKPRKKASLVSLSVVWGVLIPHKVKVGKKTKYQVRDNIFDSKTEAWRYIYLLDLQSASAISELVIQPEYILRPAYTLSGRWYKRTKSGKPRKVSVEKYHPDFRYTWHSSIGDVTVIEEVKALSKGKPYSKQASNFKQYTLQATIANDDDKLFMIAAGKSDGSIWRYFQQSHGYPELEIEYMKARIVHTSGKYKVA